MTNNHPTPRAYSLRWGERSCFSAPGNILITTTLVLLESNLAEPRFEIISIVLYTISIFPVQ